LVLNTSIDNLDNMFNDIKASKTYDMAGGKANVTGGFFYGSQNVALTWWWNTYTNSLANPSQYGAPTTIGWNTFGGCCDRTFDVRYNTTAPYAAFNFDKGPWNLDASVRNNNMTATGSTLLGAPATATTIAAGSWTGQKDTVNYSINKNSYSLGANYAVNKDMSAYGRISDGYNFSADRLLYGAVGGLNNKSPAFNEVKQQEVGVKYRNNNFSLFGTYFQAQTDETNFDALTQVSSANSYDAKGFELEAGYRLGGLRLAAGATFTTAKITKAVGGVNVGNKPMRQADMVFQLTPSYRFGDAEVGLAIIGTTESYADDANTLKLPGYTVANLFANYRIDKRTTLSMGVNNLFDTLAFTEAEAQNATGGQARALPGRTTRVSLRYDF
jgi:outer membrane receptor protein involved in Fe transport